MTRKCRRSSAGTRVGVQQDLVGRGGAHGTERWTHTPQSALAATGQTGCRETLAAPKAGDRIAAQISKPVSYPHEAGK